MTDGSDQHNNPPQPEHRWGPLSSALSPLSRDSPHRRFVQYLLVGAIGLAINEGVLFLVTGILGLSYVLGGFLGRVISISANYLLNDTWTWATRGEAGLRQWLIRGGKYIATRVVGIGIGLAALVIFVELFGLHYLIANVLAVGVGVAWGFGVSERWVWADPSTESLGQWLRKRSIQTRRMVERFASSVRTRVAVTERNPRANGGTRTLIDRAGGSRGLIDPRSIGTRLYRSARSATERDAPVGRMEWVPRSREDVKDSARTVRDRLQRVDVRTWFVVIVASTFAIGFTWYTANLYRAYLLTGADFGSYVHMMWTTVNGEGFLQQGKFRVNHPSGVYWGAHSAVTLLLFVPIYALFQSPITLLAIKSVLISASIVVLWLLAREWTGNDVVAGLVVASYAFNPFLWSAWSFDFQEQSLVPLLVFAMVYMYIKERYVLFVVLLVLTLLTNEFLVFIVAGFVVAAAIAAFRADELAERWPAIVVALGCVVVAYFVTGFIIDSFSRFGGLPARVVAIPLQPFVDHPRTSTLAVAGAAVRNPDVALQVILTDIDRKALHLIALFIPVGFLALVDEYSVLPLLPFVGFAWIIGHRPAYYTFSAHYPLYFLPFVYVGVIHTLSRRSIPDISPRWFGQLLVCVLLLNVVTLALVGPMNLQSPQGPNDHHDVLDGAVDTVPEDASIVTQNNIFPHVAERPDAKFMLSPYDVEQYEQEFGPITTEYIIFDTQHEAHWSGVVIDTFRDRLYTGYGLYKYEDGVWIYRRGYDGPTTSITEPELVSVFDGEWDQYGPDSFRLKHGERQNDVIVGEGTTPGIVWYGPYVILPPGDYTAYFEIRASGASGQGEIGDVHVKVGEDHRVIERQRVQPSEEWQTVAVSFTLEEPQAKVELRGEHYGGDGRIEFGGAEIVRDYPASSEPDPEPGIVSESEFEWTVEPLSRTGPIAGGEVGPTNGPSAEGTPADTPPMPGNQTPFGGVQAIAVGDRPSSTNASTTSGSGTPVEEPRLTAAAGSLPPAVTGSEGPVRSVASPAVDNGIRWPWKRGRLPTPERIGSIAAGSPAPNPTR